MYGGGILHVISTSQPCVYNILTARGRRRLFGAAVLKVIGLRALGCLQCLWSDLEFINKHMLSLIEPLSQCAVFIQFMHEMYEIEEVSRSFQVP